MGLEIEIQLSSTKPTCLDWRLAFLFFSFSLKWKNIENKSIAKKMATLKRMYTIAKSSIWPTPFLHSSFCFFSYLFALLIIWLYFAVLSRYPHIETNLTDQIPKCGIEVSEEMPSRLWSWNVFSVFVPSFWFCLIICFFCVSLLLFRFPFP